MAASVGETDNASKARRLPPARLRPVPRALVVPVRIFWWLCLLLAVVAQIGGCWRGDFNAAVAEPRFAALEIASTPSEGDNSFDVTAAEGAEIAGMPEHGWIAAIDGAPVRATMDAAAVAALLAGPEGATVRLTVRDDEGQDHAVTVRRGPPEDAAITGARRAAYWIGAAISLIGAMVLVFVAAMLMLRRPNDPVSLLLSLSFLFAAAFLSTPLDFYAWIEADWIGAVLPSIWLGLLVAVLPAFPDGRFVPRWGGWLAVLAIPYAALISFESLLGDLTAVIAFGGALLAAITPLIRWRRTPPGLQRQQLKWAALGFGGSIVLLGFAYSLFLLVEAGLVPAVARGPLSLFLSLVLHLCFVLLPLGVLVSLLRYRLWDVDRMIGRSSAVGIVTLFLGGGWAGVQEAVKIGFTSAGSQIDPTTIAAISTGLVAVLFPPLQSRVERWTERKLQEPIARLRELPEQWAAQGQVAEPEPLAARAFAAIRAAIAASGGDLWLAQEGQWERLEAIGDAERFPPLDADAAAPEAHIAYVLDARVAQLRFAPRPDGTGFPRDMRRILDELADPLAAALETALERAYHRKAIARIHTRLDRIEARLGG
jgi:hypothetical protein